MQKFNKLYNNLNTADVTTRAQLFTHTHNTYTFLLTLPAFLALIFLTTQKDAAATKRTNAGTTTPTVTLVASGRGWVRHSGLGKVKGSLTNFEVLFREVSW